VVTFTLQFMCVTSSLLWQLMCVTYSNLLLLQNVIKTYASEIYFCSPRRLEHNGAIGFENGVRTREIKDFFSLHSSCMWWDPRSLITPCMAISFVPAVVEL
jgi:hypothetical protein